MKIDVKFESKPTCVFKNDMKNLAKFHQITFENLKIGLFLGAFIQSRKCVSLEFTGELYVVRMKNDAKFEEELTCQFKIDMSNLINFESST